MIIEAGRILLEGVPVGLDVDDVEQAVLGVDGVAGVHDLHVWSVSSTEAVLSAHVQLADGRLSGTTPVVDGIKMVLATAFGIHHATLELECAGKECADGCCICAPATAPEQSTRGRGATMPWFAGVTRPEIDWAPSIDPKKCVSCGLCLNCGKDVFEWVDGRSVVARRDDCVIGCTTCGNLCQGHAISFPPLDELRKLYRDHRVCKQVKAAMVAGGKIPDGVPRVSP